MNPAARIVVTGCYATRSPDEVAALPNVVQVIANDDKPRFVPLIRQSLSRIDDSDARIPVAVLSTAGFDATTIDAATVSLASVNVSIKKNGSLFASMEDVNGDGLRDLVLHFARSDLVTNGDLTARTTALTLIGSLFDGRQVGGSDTVRPIP